MRPSIKTPLFRTVLFGLLAFGAGSLHADEALRRVQQSLRDQGFYYGSIDGSPGDETTQAIRRYQIRNGLAVTGQLNDETRQAIERNGTTSKSGSAPARLSRPATPPPSVEDDRRSSTGRTTVEPTPPPLSRPPAARAPESNFSNRSDLEGEDENSPPPNRPAAPPNYRPDLRVSPQSPGGPPPPPTGGIAPSPTLSNLFESTPYEFAPPAVQSDILRRAQYALARSGFYGGQADGIPGSMTAQALAEFQSVNGLRRTARLDVNTLGYLRLLPGRQTVGPRPYYQGQRTGPRPPRIIFEGRIVQ